LVRENDFFRAIMRMNKSHHFRSMFPNDYKIL
jgi:hypothetical protein